MSSIFDTRSDFNQIISRTFEKVFSSYVPEIIDLIKSYNQSLKKHCENGTVIYGYTDDNNKFIPHTDDDSPAIITLMGKMWYKHGKMLREDDKPTIEYNNGDLAWLDIDYDFHRENGPAFISHGLKYWYNHGKLIKTNINGIDN